MNHLDERYLGFTDPLVGRHQVGDFQDFSDCVLFEMVLPSAWKYKQKHKFKRAWQLGQNQRPIYDTENSEENMHIEDLRRSLK